MKGNSYVVDNSVQFSQKHWWIKCAMVWSGGCQERILGTGLLSITERKSPKDNVLHPLTVDIHPHSEPKAQQKAPRWTWTIHH